MKRIVQLFARDVYYSESDGTARVFLHDPALQELLGQAETVLVHVFGYRIDASAQATFSLYHSSIPGRPPRMAGEELGTPKTVSSLHPAQQSFTGTTGGLAEIVMEVAHASASSEVSFEMEVWATLIMGA